MDPAALQQHLAQAERHVTEGERLVASQEALVTDQHRRGYDTTDARRVLDALKVTQAVHEQDVRRLRDQLRTG